MAEEMKQYPSGYLFGAGLALGMVSGLIFSVIMHNPDLFILGIPAGLLIGAVLEMKYKRDGRIRPLTQEETKRRNILIIALLVLFLAGIGMFLLFP